MGYRHALKQRPADKNFIVLLSDPARLNLYVEEVPAIAWDLIELNHKPLSIIYSGAKNLAQGVVHVEEKTVAIRIVKENEFCMQLLHRFRKPLVSTSANISGKSYPRTYKDISPEILKGVDYVVNLPRYQTVSASPSTIMKIGTDGVFKIIRK
jgi:L-threonylcarbamoyladenylate synthase